jgi:hypothetical protein
LWPWLPHAAGQLGSHSRHIRYDPLHLFPIMFAPRFHGFVPFKQSIEGGTWAKMLILTASASAEFTPLNPDAVHQTVRVRSADLKDMDMKFSLF